MTTITTITSREEEQIQFERIGHVCLLTLTGSPHKANVFTIPLLQRLDQLLDRVEDHHLPCSLVICGRGRKFFSAGFDLQALTGANHTNSNNTNGSQATTTQKKTPQGQDLVSYSWKVLARILVFPAPTLAVFNGHAFGLGLFLGLACDHRIMMADSTTNNKKGGGKLCLPEITIGLPLGSGFAALAKCKLTPATLRTAALTGKQFSASEALQAGLVDAVVPFPSSTTEATSVPQQVLDMAEQWVSTSTKGNLTLIKQELYHETHEVLLSEYSTSSPTKPTRSKL